MLIGFLIGGPVSTADAAKTPSVEKQEPAPPSVGENSPPPAPEEPEKLSYTEKKLMAIVEKQEALLRRYAIKLKLSEYEVEDLRFRARNLVQEYESLIAESPDELTPYLLYGKFLNKIGQEEHAVKMFLKADEIDPDVPVVKQQIGNYLAETGKFEESLGFFIQAILLSPETALYHYQMGELLSTYKEQFISHDVYFRDVLENEMLQAFSDAARLDPDNPDFKMRYAECFYNLKNPDWETALALWEELQDVAISSLQREAVSLHRANVLSRLGRSDEARAIAESVTDPALLFSRDQLLEELDALALAPQKQEKTQDQIQQ